jgi:lambda family phage minor tail protein L
MGQGKDKIARSLLDLQPTAILDFYQIYPDVINHPTQVINIHAGSIFGEQVTWQGVKYIPVPIEVEGFEITANTTLPRPKIRIANVDYLVTDLLQRYSDLKNAQIIRKRTFVKYLDDVNFDGGNPFGSADSSAELSSEKYLIGQKTQENKVYVELELTSPLDLENFEVNHRRILGKYCYWMYRGEGCRYDGPPINKDNGKIFSNELGTSVIPKIEGFKSNSPDYLWQPTKVYNEGDIAFLENQKVIINPIGKEGSPEFMKLWYVCVKNNTIGQNPDSNPSYWQKDGCNKKLNSCRKRFSNSNNIEYPAYIQSVEKDFIHIQGANRNGVFEKGGYFTSAAPQLTGVYNGSFTVAMFVELGDSPISGGFLDSNFTGSHVNSLNITNTSTGPRIFYNESSTISRSIDVKIPPGSSSKFLIAFGRDYISKGTPLYVTIATSPSSCITTKYETASPAFLSFATRLIMGAQLQTAAPTFASANAIYYNLAVWGKTLNNQELSSLLTNEAESSSCRMKLYEDLPASLKDSTLLGWYEDVSLSGSTRLFLDSHTYGLNLTGSGSFVTGTETYAIQRSISKPRPIKYDRALPFGGFPGTDGFSYQP